VNEEDKHLEKTETTKQIEEDQPADPLTERRSRKADENSPEFSELLYEKQQNQEKSNEPETSEDRSSEVPVREESQERVEGENQEYEEEEEEDEDSQIPLLFVDVNLGRSMKRIILYEGDDPKYIAEMFAQDNNLDQAMRNKLERLLKKQMDGVLSKIDEGEEEIDSYQDSK
jgi:hypothetical protein